MKRRHAHLLLGAVLIGAGMAVLTRQGGERQVQSPDRSAARGAASICGRRRRLHADPSSVEP
jgi:hypothetical protein